MAEPETLEGTCLCGAVTITIRPAERHVDACHCDMCRRWAGGAFLSMPAVTDIAIEGAENVTRYRSSDWAERGFCGECGTHLFYHLLPADSYSCPSGLFARADDFPLTSEIFIDEKPATYSFAGNRERLTGAQVIAQFNAAHGQ
ncbi:GFA family protein [Stakelama tenebrarum]|uniref:GFA family protein n=1 Tax=Stakelama tenebrarum TaxID=2711215 RepID=A0A6G6Y1K7_9SPHN|nr:GFA family protein [Sphingosinithalassobacter tenebrarum]QIG78790.1 GFA family protein [Sphingosinithalassobacter tenebrarum]